MLEKQKKVTIPKKNRKKNNLSPMFYWFLMAVLLYFSLLMLRITLQYVPIRNDVAFLSIKQWVIDNDVWRVAFFTHVFTSMFALLAGFTQFSRFFLNRFPIWHRRIGYVYMIDVLFVTGPSGLIMAWYANGGWSSQLAFMVLAILWIFTTAQSWRMAMKRDFRGHQAFIIRSYALTLSALTLRAWKWLIIGIFVLRPMDVYRIVAWLGFVPNLLFAEWYIARFLSKRKTSSSAILDEVS